MQVIGKIILGTVQMGLPYGINNTKGKISPVECQKILTMAYKSGIRFLDTAEAYGNAHEVIGDFHQANPDMVFKVVTKFTTVNDKGIEDKILQFLKELHIRQLEGIMFHGMHSFNNYRNTLPGLAEIKKQGLFRHLGVSIYTNDELAEILHEDEIDIIQLPFNLLDNYLIHGELMEEAKRKGKTVQTRSTFLQGLFFKSPMDAHPVVQALQQQLIKIHQIAHEQDTAVRSLALAYCLYQSNIDQVLIGVDSLKQLKSNLEALSYRIEEKTVQKIDQIQTKNKDLLNPSLWS